MVPYYEYDYTLGKWFVTSSDTHLPLPPTTTYCRFYESKVEKPEKKKVIKMQEVERKTFVLGPKRSRWCK